MERYTRKRGNATLDIAFQFPSNGKAHGKTTPADVKAARAKFRFPSNGKAHGKRILKDGDQPPGRFVSIPFKREGTWKGTRCVPQKTRWWLVSIPFKREGTWKETLFSTQTGRGSGHPKTKRELRGAFFARKFTLKIPETLMAIEPNTIFQ